MTTIYETKVKELGSLVESFLEENMMILFKDNAPDELRDYCVLHDGNVLTEKVTAGDVFCIGEKEYEIVFVGDQVQKNLQDLGHITIRFNGNEEGESLEGSLYVEKKSVALPAIGDEIKIIRKA